MADDEHDLIDKAEEPVAKEIADVLTEVADEFAQALGEATEIVAARFSVSGISRMFTDRMPRIVRRLLGVAEKAAEHTADTVDAELPDGWDDLPGRYDDGTLPAPMSDYVKATEHLLRATGDDLADVAVRELSTGVDAGESMEQLRARLREAFAREGSQLGEHREERIARTESGRAWNTSTLAAAQALTGPDRPLVKQWVSERDRRVRHDHAKANGQLQFLDDPFTVGGTEMSAPHDPSAPAKQTVNCRCVLKVAVDNRASAYDSQTPAVAPVTNAREPGRVNHEDYLQQWSGWPPPAPAAVQAPPPDLTAAVEHTGAMIAFIPSPEDAERLALDDGEPVDELHLTAFYLTDDATGWTEAQRTELVDGIRDQAAKLGGPVRVNLFGVNHWNPQGQDPVWVWAVSDNPDDDGGPSLHATRYAVQDALEDMHDHPDLPAQHTPWVAHITGAYTADTWPLEAMADRLGPVTLDRIRIAFAGEYTDIPLDGAQTAAARPTEEPPMVRQPEATAAADTGTPTRAWHNPDDTALAFENEETGDGRIFTPDAVYWDGPGPYPLQYADEMLMGHQGAQLAGSIDSVDRDGGRIVGEGVLYLGQDAGASAADLLDEGAPLGVSVDLDDVDIEFVDRSDTGDAVEEIFASAHLSAASILRMEDGAVMLSASTAPQWRSAAGGASFARTRYDVQIITAADGRVSAATVRDALEPSGVLTAAAGDQDDQEAPVMWREHAGDFLMRITRGRLRGATLVAMPAYANARIVLKPLDETAAAAAVVPELDASAAAGILDRIVTYVCASPAAVAARVVAKAMGVSLTTARKYLAAAVEAERIVRLAPGYYTGPSAMPEGAATADGHPAVPSELMASAWQAVQDAPPLPAAWFREPTAEELPPGSGGVHYAGGRIYGWVAQAGEPHAGHPGKKLTIESLGKIDTTHFLRTRLALDNGSTVKAGAYTMNAGHHRDGAECETNVCQFDDTRTVAGVVTVGMSKGGLWFSGAAAPWLSDWDRTVFKATQPSYHMRQGPGGAWQLRAVLSVPVPGHSSPLLAATVAERSNLALAASAAITDAASAGHPDAPDTASTATTGQGSDQGGHSPDAVSAGHPQVSADALIAALTSDTVLDRLVDAMARREEQRREEIAALTAAVGLPSAQPLATLTASAAPTEGTS